MLGIVRFLLLLLPLIEIAGFVIVGGELGVLSTLGLVLLGGFVGLMLIRQGGVEAFRRGRAELNAGRDPSGTVLNGFAQVLAGILFLVPGFLSDIVAILLLLPPVRNRLLRRFKGRTAFARFGTGGSRRAPRQPVIDLPRDDYVSRPDPSSPWAGSRDTPL